MKNDLPMGRSLACPGSAGHPGVCAATSCLIWLGTSQSNFVEALTRNTCAHLAPLIDLMTTGACQLHDEYEELASRKADREGGIGELRLKMPATTATRQVV